MAFPTQPVVDSFTRANENPLSFGGLWADGGTGTTLQVTANTMAASGAGSALAGWVNIASSGDVEFYVTWSTRPSAAETVYLLYRCSTVATYGPNGYYLAYDLNTQSLSNGRLDGGAFTGLSHDFVPGSDGDYLRGFGVAATGSSHHLYRFSNDFTWSDTFLVNTDGTYTAAGYFSVLLAGGTTGRYASVGMGPVSSVPPGGGTGVFSGSAVPSSHSLDRGMYKAVARGIAR